jgi:hypothetical protein
MRRTKLLVLAEDNSSSEGKLNSINQKRERDVDLQLNSGKVRYLGSYVVNIGHEKLMIYG